MKVFTTSRTSYTKTLFVVGKDELNENFARATNNLFWTEIKFSGGLTAWSLVFNKRFVFTKTAINEIFA